MAVECSETSSPRAPISSQCKTTKAGRVGEVGWKETDMDILTCILFPGRDLGEEGDPPFQRTARDAHRHVTLLIMGFPWPIPQAAVKITGKCGGPSTFAYVP